MCGAIEGCVDQQKGPCSNKKKECMEQHTGVWCSRRVYRAIEGCMEQYKGAWSNTRVQGAIQGCMEQ